jgi:hypothetical protein
VGWFGLAGGVAVRAGGVVALPLAVEGDPVAALACDVAMADLAGDGAAELGALEEDAVHGGAQVGNAWVDGSERALEVVVRRYGDAVLLHVLDETRVVRADEEEPVGPAVLFPSQPFHDALVGGRDPAGCSAGLYAIFGGQIVYRAHERYKFL